MPVPGGFVCEDAGLGREAIEETTGKFQPAHYGERFVVDDVLGRASAQELEERQPRTGIGGAEDREAVVADLGGESVASRMARARVVPP